VKIGSAVRPGRVPEIKKGQDRTGQSKEKVTKW